MLIHMAVGIKATLTLKHSIVSKGYDKEDDYMKTVYFILAIIFLILGLCGIPATFGLSTLPCFVAAKQLGRMAFD